MSIFGRFGRSRTSRRLDARLSELALHRTWLEQLRVSGAFVPILIVGAFALAAVGLVLSAEERLEFVAGQTVDVPILARVDFQRPNQTKTAQLIEAAQRATPNHFRLNTALLERVAGDLRTLQTDARAAESYEKFMETTKDRWKLGQAGYDLLRRAPVEEGPTRFDEWIEKLTTRLAGENLVLLPTATERDPTRESSTDAVLNRGPGRIDRVSKQRLGYATNEQHVTRLAKDLAEVFPSPLQPAVAQVLISAIRVDPAKDRYEPVYVFDADATQSALDRAREIPPVQDQYQRGQVLVPSGTALTPELLDLVQSEHERYLEARQSSPELYRAWVQRRIGQAGIVLLLVLGVAVYTSRYQAKLSTNATHCLSVAGLLLAVLLLARLLAASDVSRCWVLTPTVYAAAILTIVYSPRYAFGVATALAGLVTLTISGAFDHFLVLAAVSAVVIFRMDDVRSRMKLIWVGLLAAGTAMITAAFVGLAHQQALRFLAGEVLTAGAASLLACGLVLVSLPVIERVFGLATSMTLLEWADMSTPLLKQLIQKAPGTWQHSHLIGSMAESAAEEIGANGLLVRVGAYYHDVGKMMKPEYFVENQPGHTSAHARLAPRMSLLVILGHVKDGLALAEDYGLPKVLHKFIAEHHGTTLVRYFHAMAARNEMSKGALGDERAVEETEFRYPGPKPRSKESAILMLCDGVEGAVRSLTEPNPSRIESVVHEILMNRLMDGQLDDCDLTLKELFRIEQSLVRSLCSIYHGRIAYPKTPAPAQPVSTTPRTA